MEVSLQKDQTRLQFSTPSEFSNFIGHKLENASLVCCNALQELGRCCSIIPNGLLTSLYYDQNVLLGLVTVYRVQLLFLFFLLVCCCCCCDHTISNHNAPVDVDNMKRSCISDKRLCVSSARSLRNLKYGDPIFFSIRIGHWHRRAFQFANFPFERFLSCW